MSHAFDNERLVVFELENHREQQFEISL